MRAVSKKGKQYELQRTSLCGRETLFAIEDQLLSRWCDFFQRVDAGRRPGGR